MIRRPALTAVLLGATSPALAGLDVPPAQIDPSLYVKIADLPSAIAASAPVTSVNGAVGAIISTKMQATSVSDKAVSNTLAETSIVGTLAAGSSMTISGTACYVGKAYRLRVAGQFTTPLTPGNLTAKVKLGSVVIGTKTITNLLSLATNADWSGDVIIVFRSCGVSGTALVGGTVTYDTGVQVPGAASLYNGVVTLDTTAPMVVDATATWAAASTTRSIGTYLVSLESLN